MNRFVVSYWHEKHKTWEITGMFDKQDDAIAAARELFRDFLVVSDWAEVRITKLRGY
jgi:hypothetical protein